MWASSDDETRTALLDEAVRRSPTGALALRGILRELLPLPPGRWTLRFGLGASPIPAATARSPPDTSAQTTRAPSRANSAHVAAPIPAPPPVTMADRPSNRPVTTRRRRSPG